MKCPKNHDFKVQLETKSTKILKCTKCGTRQYVHKLFNISINPPTPH